MFRHRSLITFLLLFTGSILTLGLLQLDQHSKAPKLFSLLSSDQTGIDFVNKIEDSKNLNVLEFEYAYNGGGVSIGDINGDQLPDLFFTRNVGPDALYLNQGHLHFREIGNQAGVANSRGWSSGTTMADINGDGLLDIYVCKTGHGKNLDDRRNKLFINQGNMTFKEESAKYGLDDPGYSTQALFFDYDRDGDLDMYLVNYATKRFKNFDVVEMRKKTDPYAGDKLYRNDGDHFTDVSKKAGIIQNPIGFGLSATASDVNKDGWMDLYVANDFMERDYLYINQHDGTFKDQVQSRLSHISYYSMGSDIADFNNDSWPDIFTVDMLGASNHRQKMMKGPDYSKYDALVLYGYHRQNMRNMLQMNNGNGTFSEIGQLAGISATDWSWAVLATDFDNDGWKDLYVTNGFMHDYTNLDYLHNHLWKTIKEGREPDNLELVQEMPSTRLHNFMYKNNGDLTFSDEVTNWGFDQAAYSNGAAYGDLDNDGDLDLVVNNINRQAFIYKNNSRDIDKRNYLTIELKGNDKNTQGIGAKVQLTAPDGQTFYKEMNPVRGFQSSMDPRLHFGLEKLSKVNVHVTWQDGKEQVLKNISVNQQLVLNQRDAENLSEASNASQSQAFEMLDEQKIGLDFRHKENSYNDFNKEPLLPHHLTDEGPALAHADVNNDGLEDVYIGGARNQAGQLYLQQMNGTFKKANIRFFEVHKNYEDVAATFFDADGDGDQDLYVVSGGNYDVFNGKDYQDRLYLNNGFGDLVYVEDLLPKIHSSGGTVAPADFDGDGDIDLFVGGRVKTGKYPEAPRSYLLENDGKGTFTDITQKASQKLVNPGMVTTASWADLTGDQKPDLILGGEWMPIRIFRNNADKTFTEITDQAGLEKSNGWWNQIKIADMDNDGDPDIVAGNQGMNDQLKASANEPVEIYAGDFDQNGFNDPIITYYMNGKSYPFPTRDELITQISSLKNKFPSYQSYANATIEDVLTQKQRNNALHLKAYRFASTIFENQGNGTFSPVDLPNEAQVAPMNDFIVADFNNDKIPDILLAGNNFGMPARQGPLDAGQGSLLLGKGHLEFQSKPARDTGFFAPEFVRKLQLLRGRIGPIILVGNNNARMSSFVFRPGRL